MFQMCCHSTSCVPGMYSLRFFGSPHLTLATGIFIVPLIAGKEPRGQGTLAILLLIAVAIVVFGSLAGEYAGARGWLGDLWFWLGHQGWEYLDLGRLWQILLVIGLFLWVLFYFADYGGRLEKNTLGTCRGSSFMQPWRYRLSTR